MTGSASFTREEWLVLARTPADVMFGVVVSSYGGLRRELSSIRHTLRDADEFPAETELVEELSRFVATNARELHRRAESRPMDRARVLARTGDDCREAAALMDGRVTDEERAEYGAFVLWCAERVALAGVEGGVFGVGGHRLGRRERRFLDSVADALGVSRPGRSE